MGAAGVLPVEYERVASEIQPPYEVVGYMPQFTRWELGRLFPIGDVLRPDFDPDVRIAPRSVVLPCGDEVEAN